MPASRGGGLALAAITLLAYVPSWTAAASPFAIVGLYASSSCFEDSRPSTIFVYEVSSCDAIASMCAATPNSSYFYETECADDYDAYLTDRFPTGDYLLENHFNSDSGCFDWRGVIVFPVDSKCHPAADDGSSSARPTSNSNGSVAFEFFNDKSCTADALSWSVDVSQDAVEGSACREGAPNAMSSVYFNSYTVISADADTDWSRAINGSGSGDESSSGSSQSGSGSSLGSSSRTSDSVDGEPVDNAESGGSSSSTAVVVVIAVVVVLLVAAGVLFYCYRRKKNSTKTQLATSAVDYFGLSNGDETIPSGGLWSDEAIIAARITRSRVKFERLLSRGGYGEVYLATYEGERVAAKTLLPERRKQLRHVTDLLAEAKLMAGLEHPRVVQLVGVAWDSLANLCVVVEFMPGGDLRSLLSQFEASSHPRGFDAAKLRIAKHVAHALTYLHSLQPMILHRDLKSRNVLLDGELNAKLTDFGVSRERMDATMTAGVGTSLWMAPEVLLGGKYDDKADVFSFGVLLSELDLHELPYASAKDSESGRKLPDTVILQLVIQGKLHVEFSADAAADVVALGEACVAVDPQERPTSAEVLYKLDCVLRGMA